ncbi:hypothetical protein BC937DRAFT_90893 [Endogone sp. FLAS-F59071]|nr:hypothetical protein BC937DRAFT_90893 [Endogone sp. FLAS-F59071]|eukprot:RUS23189.1 hypothetical protein BC937DRAFT_90893 [Endogone sp. FLAS-F59071]
MSFLQKATNAINANLHEAAFKVEEFAEAHLGYEDEEEREAAINAKKHRYQSFAPVRLDTEVKWYIDGKDYFWAVSEAIESAKYHIYIEDWWLSPELYLRRPPSKYPEYRLDTLLKRKAAEGVKVYIVVYEEVPEALSLNSKHSEQALQGHNIVVQRHPDHSLGGTFFWAKICVVDTRIAFIGGLDLCFGRWDTHDHQLADYHPSSTSNEIWPGQDYNNARYKDFAEVENWNLELADKRSIARMPWHDISVGILGQPVLDIAKHFCERWNFIKKEKSEDRPEVTFLEPPLGGFTQSYAREADSSRRVKHQHNLGTHKGTSRVQVLRSSAQWSHDIVTEHSIQNAYIESIRSAQHFIYIENQFFITSTTSASNYEIKNQIGAALVDRIIRAKENREKFRVIVVMPLAPAFAGDIASKEASVCRLVMYWQYASISRGQHSIFEKLRAADIEPSEYISFYSLRSYDRINRSTISDALTEAAGLNLDTKSVLGAAGQGASATLIRADDTEPDFVRGTSGSRHGEIEGRVRIPSEREADRLQERFDAAAPRGGVARDSIASDVMLGGGDVRNETYVGEGERGSHGERMSRDPANPDERANYISEELYIHTKVMIVDDRIVICGSANLNDRSQCGDHDSEIAVIVEDATTIPSKMNGEYVRLQCCPFMLAQYFLSTKPSHFAATLRRQLFKEHLGLIPPTSIEAETDANRPPPYPYSLHKDPHADRIVEDPLSNEFMNHWTGTAKRNTEAFRNVFRAVPDDGVSTWEEYKAFYPYDVPVGHVGNKNLSVNEIREVLSTIRGHLVQFPTEFLNKVDLKGDAVLDINDLIMELYT